MGTLALNVNMMAAMYFFFIGTLRVRRWKYKDPLIIYGPMLLLTVATPLMCLQPFCKVLKDHTLRVMDIPAEIFLLISIFGIMFARMLIKKKPWGPFEVRHAPWGLLWVSIGFMLFSVLCIVLVYLDIAQQRMGPILMQTQLVCGMKVTSIGKVGSLGYSSTVLKVLSWVGIIVFAVAAMWNVDIWEKLKKIKNKWAELQEERRRAQVAQTQYESTGLLVDNSRA